MSSVDNRIVKLKFDNSQFEANVSKSMSTLDKLKEKLNFKDSAKDIENLQTAVNKVDFSAMQSSLQFLEKRFSATGEFIYKIWDQITDKAINAFKRVESATIGQIKSGGWARALNIANAQFQTAGLGASWDAIKAAADYAVTDTAYGLDEAAKTASQLLASGVDYQEIIEETDEGGLTQMHKALRAISGVAAMTNSSYSEIAHIFTRIAGSGRVFAIDLNSIAARGLNAAAVLAKALGTTEAEIRELTRQGEIDFNTFAMAMDEAYGEHAKQANETFQGAMSNMKAALSRIGAIFAQPMIDKTNRFFNAITGRIKEVQRALSDVKLSEDEVSPRFATHFAEAWDAAVTAAVNFVNAIDLDWLKSVANTMDNIAIKMKSFFDWINEGFAQQSEGLEEAAEDAKESLKDMIATQEEYKAAMHIMFKDKTLTGNKRKTWLEQQGLNPQRVQKYIDSVVAAGWNVNKASIKVQDSIDETKDSVMSLESEIDKLPKTFEEFNRMEQAGQDQFLKDHPDLIRAYRDTDNWIQEITEKEQEAADEMKAYMAVSEEYRKIKGWSKDDWRGDFLDERMTEKRKKELFEKYPQLLDKFNEVKNERKHFEGIAAVFFNISGSISNIATNIKTIIRAGKNAFHNVFNVDTILPGLVEFTDKFHELTDALLITEGGEAKLQGGFEVLFTIIRGGIGLIGKFVMKLMDVAIWIANIIRGTNEVNQNTGIWTESTGKAQTIFASLWKIISKTAGSIKDLILNFGDFISMVKNTEGVQRLGKAMSDLGKRFRKDVSPASDSLAEFADSYDGLSIDGLAKAIGWIADKIAWLVEQIPKLLDIARKAFGVVSGFVTEVWDKIRGWFDGKDAGSIFDEVKSRLVGAWEYTKDIGDNIGEFFTMVWNAIKTSLSNLDFDTLKDVSKAAALLFGIYELARIIYHLAGFMEALHNVPKSISSFFFAMSESIKQFGLGFQNFGIAAIIQSIAWLFISIAVFIGVIASINEDALTRATGVAVLVGIFVVMLVKVIKSVQQGGLKVKGNMNRVTVKLFDSIFSIAALLASIGLVMKLFTDSVASLTDTLNKGANAEKAIGIITRTILIISGIAAAILVLLGVAQILTKRLGQGDERTLTGPLVGMALIIAAIGLAIKWVLFAIGNMIGAMALGKTTPETLDKISSMLNWLFVGLGVMIALVFVGMSKILEASQGTAQMWAGVAMILLIFLGIAVIIKEVAVIAGLGRFVFKWDTVLMTLALIGGVLLAIGGMVYLIGKGAAKMKGEGDTLLDVAIIMAVAVVGLALIIHNMSKLMNAVSKVGTAQSLIAMGGMVLAIAVFMGGIVAILAIITKAMNAKDSKVTSGDILIISASLVIMAAAFVVFANAMEKMAAVHLDGGQIKVLLGFVGVIAGLAVVAAFVKDFAKNILSIGVGFAAAGLGVLLLGKGLELVGKGLGYFAMGLAQLNGVINKNTLIFLGLLVAGLWAIAVIVKTVIGPLGKGIEGIMSGVGSLASGLMGALDKILQNIPDLVERIIELIKSIGKPIIGAIKDMVKPIWNAIKGLIKKFSDWYNNLPTMAKKKLVRLILGVVLVLEAIAPDVITSILRILFKVLDTIAEHAYIIANKLVQFIVLIIHALAEAVARNAHVIGNALKAVLYAILAILAEAINVVFGWIPGVSSWLTAYEAEAANQIKLLTADTKTWIKNMNAQDEAMQKNLETSSSLKDTISEYAKELGFAKDNVEELTDAEKERDAYHDNRMQETYGTKKEETDTDEYIPKGNALDTALSNLTENEKAIYDQYLKYQGQAAEEYRKKHIDVISQIEKAEEEDRRISLARQSSYASIRVNDLLSSWVKNKTGMDYNFATMTQAQRDQMFKDLPGLQDEYNRVIYEISKMDNVIAETEENMKRAKFVNDARHEAATTTIEDTNKMTEALEEYNKVAEKSDFEGIKGFFKMVTGGSRDVGEGLADTVDDIKNGPSFVSTIEEFLGLDRIKDIPSTLNDSIEDTVKEMTSPKNMAKVTAAGTKIGSSMLTGTNEECDKFSESGVMAKDGLIKGATGNDQLAEVAAAGSLLGFTLLNATNKALGVQSPSKMMAETGKFSILGLIQGLTDNAAALNSTSEQIGDAMIVSFGQPFERIAQMASGAIPYNPSITPVLDSSTMASDIYGLNSMFQGQTVSLDGYTGRLAADISGVQNQNEAIVDQLRELRMDMNEMTETILGMQIVLDSGTVIGELSDGMDYSLGVSSLRKKRGN